MSLRLLLAMFSSILEACGFFNPITECLTPAGILALHDVVNYDGAVPGESLCIILEHEAGMSLTIQHVHYFLKTTSLIPPSVRNLMFILIELVVSLVNGAAIALFHEQFASLMANIPSIAGLHADGHSRVSKRLGRTLTAAQNSAIAALADELLQILQREIAAINPDEYLWSDLTDSATRSTALKALFCADDRASVSDESLMARRILCAEYEASRIIDVCFTALGEFSRKLDELA